KGVDVQNGAGTMELNKVNVSGFTMGVHASKGKVNIKGDSTIEVIANGTGLMVSGNGATVSMTQGKIMGGGGSGTGLSVQNGTGTLTDVGIEGFKKGVEVTAGTLNINMGSIEFESGSGNYGVQVQNGASAIITGATIKGKGTGTGLYVMGTATMNGGGDKKC
uniref:hypothetical protein n=1 Tax=Bartonella bovis TaxID=155194 RepID=UPI00195B2348